MIKAGFIGAVVGFIYTMSLALLVYFFTLCLTPLLGFGVGYLTAWFDKPNNVNSSLLRGGIAGAITGLGVVAGQMSATVVSAILVINSEQLPIFMRELGLSELIPTNATEYWQTTLTANSFCGILNFGIATALGVIGSMVWFYKNNRDLHTISTG